MKLPHHRKYILGIHQSFPLIFAKQCVCCGYDFVRESMWSFVGGPFYGTSGKWYYMCRECAPTRWDAHRYANLKFGNASPTSAPPPPPPTKKP